MRKRLLYRGSVKDIYQTSRENELFFRFSNRYSVFDWGEMPENLDKKGEALAQMGIIFFRYFSRPGFWEKLDVPSGVDGEKFRLLKQTRAYHDLCSRGLDHHFLDVDAREKNAFYVEKTQVHWPVWTGSRYNYWKYASRPTGALVPLEIIFRFGVPEGSSLLKRVGKTDYLRTLGLSKAPKAGDWLSFPIVEFSSKLEREDRYLSYQQAQEMASLSSSEFQRLRDTALLLACALKNIFDDIDLELWDGKFEFSFGQSHQYPERRFQLVDSIGIDELRLLKEGVHLSKEFLRRQYRKSDWYRSVEAAKKEAAKYKRLDWKQYCTMRPDRLPTRPRELAELMYQAVTNLLSFSLYRKKVFDLPISENDIFKEMRKYS